ncbi:MAG: cell division protein CrgA [Sporichthyaceae bacterium]
MAKSPIRRPKKGDKGKATPTPAKLGPSPRWVAPLMLGLFGFGLLWIVIYYVSGGDYPVTSLDNYNLLVGFGFITGGFVTSTQWR